MPLMPVDPLIQRDTRSSRPPSPKTLPLSTVDAQMSALQDQQETGPAGNKKRPRRSKAEAPRTFRYEINDGDGAGTCAMSASLQEPHQDSQLRSIPGTGWIDEAPYDPETAATAAPAALTTTASPPFSPAALSSPSSGASSPYGPLPRPAESIGYSLSRRSSQARRQSHTASGAAPDPRSFRAVVGIESARSPPPPQIFEEGPDDAVYEPDGGGSGRRSRRRRLVTHSRDRCFTPGSPRSRSRDHQVSPGHPRGLVPHGEDLSRREYLDELDAELNNLRMHILQRANGHVP